MPNKKTAFWETKSLQQMTQEEWESLCDGCGRCCLNKLEDDDTGEIYFTDVACKLLNIETCRCRQYQERVQLVPDCLVLSPKNPEYFNLLPDSCAYRRLSLGLPLPKWHPLITGKSNSVHTSGISVRGKCFSEEHIHPNELEHRIIEFHDS